MSMTEENPMNLLTIWNGNLPYVVQNERYASSGVSVLISFARVSIVSVNSPFLQSHRQRKMAARFFLHSDHLAKVVFLSFFLSLETALPPRLSLDPCIR